MAFPEVERVIYERNPLDEVICQLRFPAILKIDEPPIAFQEQIRTRYPFRRRCAASVRNPIGYISKTGDDGMTSLSGP